MKIYTGGWVAEVPENVEFIEFSENGNHTRATVTFFDAEGEKLEPPEWSIPPPPDHWTKRVS